MNPFVPQRMGSMLRDGRIATEIWIVDANLILLGRHDVFDAFVLGFDQRAGLILIEPY